MPVIGFLNGGSSKGYQSLVAAFHQGLSESGYVEGQNLAIEYLCVPKIRFGNIGGEVHRELAVK